MQHILKDYPNLTILSGSVHDLVIKKGTLGADIGNGDIGAEVGGITLGMSSCELIFYVPIVGLTLLCRGWKNHNGIEGSHYYWNFLGRRDSLRYA
jgi:hypothetical protein